jgi:DNA/RNA endonuclease YhcR with UshA esterase domain
MLGRQERIALLLLVGVAVTVFAAHAVLSMIGKPPFAHSYTENSHEGDLVLLEGTVTRAALIENGGHLSLVVNNTSVFIPSSAAQGLVVHKGDTIVAYGIVQTYRGEKEIVISSAEDIRITTIP